MLCKLLAISSVYLHCSSKKEFFHPLRFVNMFSMEIFASNSICCRLRKFLYSLSFRSLLPCQNSNPHLIKEASELSSILERKLSNWVRVSAVKLLRYDNIQKNIIIFLKSKLKSSLNFILIEEWLPAKLLLFRNAFHCFLDSSLIDGVS